MRCHYCDREIGTARVCPYCQREIQKKTLPHQLPAGTLIDGRYRVEGVLGEGGFGITYLGYNQKLGLPVAIKEYFPQGTTYRDTSGNHEVYVSSESAEAFFNHGKERFLSEAKTLVRFNAEPGIVSVMDFVEENKTAYLIMEYLDGETLQQYLKRHGKLSATETFEMLEPMMRTLEKVHAAGVIHRDISPDNIMRLKNGQLKLMDFGAAREFVDENRSMSIMLKKGYAPAEQYRRNGEQGPWTDVYALCATIYRCITGVTPTDSLDRMSGEEMKKPSELGADISPAYEGLLMYGMALHQKDRCQSMGELIGLSEQATHNESTPKKAKPENATPPKKHSAKESNATVLVASKQADPYATVYAEKTNADEFAPVNTEQKPQEKPKKPKKKGLLIAIISIVLAAAIGVTAFVIWDNQRLKTNPDDYKFEIMDADYIKIRKYTGNDTKIAIPSEIDGYKVISIGFQAFSGCTGLTSITIPDSVTSISEYAFSGCTGLTSITIPDSVTSISEYAFSGCTGLTSITIPDSVTSIGNEAFSCCSGLTSISVSSGNTVYDSRNNCNAVIKTKNTTLILGCKSTVIPDSVRSIGGSAFSGCTGLKSVTIPNYVTSIDASAFYDCTGLKSVTIPDSVTSIGAWAFFNCTGLTSVTIPDSVTSICDHAFSDCTGLTSVTIPDAVTSICDSAFYGCKGLTSVTIPDSVTSIGGSAFSDCTGLTSITIPDSVTSIGDLAFSLCTGLTSVTIPDSVTSIGNGAFYGCNNLTIYGSKGSAAEKYANDNGIEFREI